MDWARQRVLVTGAGGFIGSHLTERLVALGAEARALVRYSSSGSRGWLDDSPARDDIEVVVGDVRDPDSIAGAFAGVDVVFHLAAMIAIPHSYVSPAGYVRTNVEGTLNVLQAAREKGAGLVVHTSTSEVYGTARYVPMDEAHPLQGQSPYSATKIGADKIAEAFHRSYGLPVATIRPFNTFGPRQSSRAIIPTIVTQALAGDKISLGSLSPTRDMTYVADTVEGFVKVAESPSAVGTVTNIGSGTEISVGDMAAAVFRSLGKEGSVLLDEKRLRPEGSEVDRLFADTRRARDTLGWSPEHSFDRGIAKTIEWIKENLGRYRVGHYAT